jgi:hypothetical protein
VARRIKCWITIQYVGSASPLEQRFTTRAHHALCQCIQVYARLLSHSQSIPGHIQLVHTKPSIRCTPYSQVHISNSGGVWDGVLTPQTRTRGRTRGRWERGSVLGRSVVVASRSAHLYTTVRSSTAGLARRPIRRRETFEMTGGWDNGQRTTDNEKLAVSGGCDGVIAVPPRIRLLEPVWIPSEIDFRGSESSSDLPNTQHEPPHETN